MQYFICNLRTQETRHFPDYKSLITFLARNQVREKYEDNKETIWNNAYLDCLAMNLNDSERCINIFTDSYCYVQRKYIVYDEDDRIVDIRDFYDDIVKRRKEQLEKQLKAQQNYRPVSRYHFVFRKEPVPHTNMKYRYGKYYRRLSYLHKQIMTDESYYPEFIRPKRRATDDGWLERVRHLDRCWKQQKIRKQWQKHAKQDLKLKALTALNNYNEEQECDIYDET